MKTTEELKNLLYKNETVADAAPDAIAAAQDFCEGYKTFLDNAKTEREATAYSEKLLTAAGYTPEETERVAWLVGHHHTYDPIEGMDHQILVEADFLVNLHEDSSSPEAIRRTRDTIFRTDAGKHLCQTMF